MSYILDALRKSEQQRQQGAAPMARLAQVATTAPRRPSWPVHGLTAATLVAAGIAIGWLQPWQPGPSAPEPVRAIDAVPSPSAAASVAEPPAAQPARQASPAPAPAMAPADAAANPPAEPEPAPAPQALARSELPPSIRQEIPELTISLHAYSAQPKERIAMINGQMLREGEDIAAGLRLAEITPDGVVIAYRGYRFLQAR